MSQTETVKTSQRERSSEAESTEAQLHLHETEYAENSLQCEPEKRPSRCRLDTLVPETVAISKGT